MEIHKILQKRFSPNHFLNKPIENKHLDLIFEAGRWAPSCFNEQPWRFLYAHNHQTEKFNAIVSCLAEKNQEWAKNAPLLIIAFAKKNFAHNNKPNKWAWYDTGQSVAYMTIQAMEFNIYTHQMGGFSKEKIIQTFNISDIYEPTSVIAMGYLDDMLYDKELSLKNRSRIDKSKIFIESSID
jgi:nitroreductase